MRSTSMPAAAFAVVGLMLLAAPVAARRPQAGQDPNAAAPRISLADFKKLVDQGSVQVIDVRDPQSYAAGHIPDAINVPLDRLEQQLPALRRARKPIVTYCS
jgi:predicted sulfurtransferase